MRHLGDLAVGHGRQRGRAQSAGLHIKASVNQQPVKGL